MAIRHRDEHLEKYQATASSWLGRMNDKLCAWLAHHLLASKLMFDIALFLPVVTVGNAALAMKVLIFSNWIQWWALPALQRTANEITARQDAQADANHETMMKIHAMVKDIHDRGQ
jgi:hypothetical protein